MDDKKTLDEMLIVYMGLLEDYQTLIRRIGEFTKKGNIVLAKLKIQSPMDLMLFYAKSDKSGLVPTFCLEKEFLPMNFSFLGPSKTLECHRYIRKLYDIQIDSKKWSNSADGGQKSTHESANRTGISGSLDQVLEGFSVQSAKLLRLAQPIFISVMGLYVELANLKLRILVVEKVLFQLKEVARGAAR